MKTILTLLITVIAAFGISAQTFEMVKELLKSQRHVSEISYLVGFNTPSYFSKCFKETFGCTPAEFQQDPF